MMVGPSFCGKVPPMEDLSLLKIGQRVECNGYYGTLLYVGNVPPAKGTWLGIDWDDPSRGKHDGSHEVVKYFKTSHPTSGSFVRLGKVNFGQSCVAAIHGRYGEVKDDNTAGINKEHLARVQKEINAPFMEVVGFDKVNKQQSQFGKLKVVYLKEHMINGAGSPGELLTLCPKIRELDLAANLITSWQDVADITVQLAELKVLIVSENRLTLPNDPTVLQDSFRVLEHIIAGKMAYSWKEVLCCVNMWPRIQQLQVPFNCISSIEPPTSNVLNCLKYLDLEGNPINDWAEINKLGNLPCLEILNVSSVGVSDIYFPTDQPDQKTELFPVLKYIHISENNIQRWEPICELDKLKNLDELRFRENPVMQHENLETCRQLIIARIGSLQKLNGAIVTADERKGAEYDYLKKHGRAWLSMGMSPDRDQLLKEFTNIHPRYPKLVQKYGAPEEGELKVLSTSLKTNLISVEIHSPDHPSKTYKKKLPKNMMVQKLIGLVQKLFNTGNEVPTLAYVSSKKPGVEILLDQEFKELHFYSVEDGDRISVRW